MQVFMALMQAWMTRDGYQLPLHFGEVVWQRMKRKMFKVLNTPSDQLDVSAA